MARVPARERTRGLRRSHCHASNLLSYVLSCTPSRNPAFRSPADTFWLKQARREESTGYSTSGRPR